MSPGRECLQNVTGALPQPGRIRMMNQGLQQSPQSRLIEAEKPFRRQPADPWVGILEEKADEQWGGAGIPQVPEGFDSLPA